MTTLGPLRFHPIFRRCLWGGRRLKSVLGKPIGDDGDYAESWEVVDHGEDQSRVIAGPLEGTTLAEIVHRHGGELLGRHAPLSRFPLLFKFLDAHRNLSVQVHPNDEQASALDPPDFGKTEAWIVLHAEAGSRIYAGLKPGVDRDSFRRAVKDGAADCCLHHFVPQPGDCVFIPAGTVHALGAGLVVAELQQASDATFRLFDWNRVGPDGQPRTLHIEQGLEVVDYHRGPVFPQPPSRTQQDAVDRLVACDKFVIDRRRPPEAASIGGDQRFHLLAVVAGRITLPADPHGEPLATGQTVLLPASLGKLELQTAPDTVLIDMYLP